MSGITETLTPKEKARFLEAARVAGLWFLHNQNAPGRRWGGVDQSADTGRFLYEYFPATGQCRSAGVWSQALGVCSLLALADVFRGEESHFAEAAKLGAGYLCSLQCLDGRQPHSYGAFHEHTPQTTWGSCRDGATGCFGMAVLARETGEADYLERADLYCGWYNSDGSTAEKWPNRFYYFDKNEPFLEVPGDWQAGGALCYYYTARAAGDDRWIDQGLRPVAEKLLELGDPKGADGDANRWHGESRITVGNDDFATVAAMAAFVCFDDERYIDLARRRIEWMMSLQDEDGSFPNGGGTFVTALTLLEFLEVVKLKGLPDDTRRMTESLMKAARFGLTLQNHDPRDVRAYGGLWGQSNYGMGRDRIHNRSTNYAIHLWLRLAGHRAPCFAVTDWEG
jgi:hypothetical protein